MNLDKTLNIRIEDLRKDFEQQNFKQGLAWLDEFDASPTLIGKMAAMNNIYDWLAYKRGLIIAKMHEKDTNPF